MQVLNNKIFKLIVFLIFTAITSEQSFGQNSVDSLGRRQGAWIIVKQYDSSLDLRNVTIHINYKNDTLHGTYQIYDSRERLRFSVDFYHGLEEGPAYLYSKRGRVIRTYFYDSSAVRLVALHKRSRNPYLIFEVENGVKDGYEISFGIFGRIKYVSFYEEGKQKKVQTSYNWRYREHYSIYYKK